MARLENIYEEVLQAAGTTSTINLNYNYEKYVYTGTGALVGNIVINTSGTPVKGHVLKIQWNCTFSAGGATVTILGTSLSTSLYGKTFNIDAYYNGSSWDVAILPDFFETQIVTTNNIIDLAVTTAKINTSAVDVAKMSTAANKQITVLEVSFESGEQCNNSITMPNGFTLNSIYYEVIKALANTDAGTITPRIDGVAVTLSVAISIPLSTPVNTTASTNCTAANTGSAGAIVSFVAAKTTAGGKVRLTLNWTKTS